MIDVIPFVSSDAFQTYRVVSLTNQIDEKLITLGKFIDPKEIVFPLELEQGKLYLHFTQGSAIFFKVCSIPYKRYTYLSNYSIYPGTGKNTYFFLKLSYLENYTVFHIPKETEVLLKIVLPDFPTVEEPDYDAYRSRRKGT